MSKIFLTSGVTGALISISIDQIEEIVPRISGNGSVVKRRGRDNLLVVESVEQVRIKIENLAPPKPKPTQQIVQQQVRVVQPVYRPKTRSDDVLDTAMGVGLGVIGASIVEDLLDNFF